MRSCQLYALLLCALLAVEVAALAETENDKNIVVKRLRRRSRRPAPVATPAEDDYEEETREEEQDGDDTVGDVVSDIHRAGKTFQHEKIVSVFKDKKSFLCPLVKPALHTGTSMRDLSPEDIDVVAAMGDSLASGRGLWPPTDVEFRGAAFPIGGDANIDGLVTLPNILLEFNDELQGVSHGMGDLDHLPTSQFNVAKSGATTADLPKQAEELVRRLKEHFEDLVDNWVLISIVIGTEELCSTCDEPSKTAMRLALAHIRRSIPRAFVVLLGPVHVASSYTQNINLLKPRCKCLESQAKSAYKRLIRRWADIYYDVQLELNSLNSSTFGVLAIPQLTIHSRDPNSLFIEHAPLLNRKGHTYAAKWLWNRLMGGLTYDASTSTYSSEPYFCAAPGCPYFRTPHNFDHCSVITEDDWKLLQSTTRRPRTSTVKPTRRELIRRHLGAVIVTVIGFSAASVIALGTAFYCHGKRASKGRFEELTGV